MLRSITFALALCLPLLAAAAEPAKVTMLRGQAFLLPGGDAAKKSALAQGASVKQGDAVETAEKSLLELTLPDASVIRVAPKSRLQLEAAHFEATGARSFSARLMFGSVWSKVSTVLGGDTKFEVKTDNAVAGVRGTTFRVDAKSDKSAVVSVFAGSVAVAGNGPLPGLQDPPKDGQRREKAGPREVSKNEWEKLVLAMMKVKVAPDGKLGELEPIAPGDLDEFAKFNQERDAR